MRAVSPRARSISWARTAKNSKPRRSAPRPNRIRLSSTAVWVTARCSSGRAATCTSRPAASRDFPSGRIRRGAGVQLQYGPVYAAAAYRNRQGETGERGMIWHEFGTHQVTANAAPFARKPAAQAFRAAEPRLAVAPDRREHHHDGDRQRCDEALHSRLDAHLRAQRDSIWGASTNLRTAIRTCAPAWPIRSSTANRR